MPAAFNIEEITMFTATHQSHEAASMLRVRAAADIEYLVKESEVMTGEPGRTFVISGADRLVYRIRWHPIGCIVQRLDDHGNATSTQYVLHGEFEAHSVSEALRAGQLFTPMVSR
jgi:hypothetical protein